MLRLFSILAVILGLFSAAPVQAAPADAQNTVYLDTQYGRVTIKPIRAGRDLGDDLEVLSGVSPGDRIINSPPDSLVSGETIRIADAQDNAVTVAQK